MSQTNRLKRLKQINAICESFENHWLQEKDPRIEDYLNAVDSVDRAELLSELVRIEVFYLSQQGQPPEIQSYHQRFPEMSNGIIRAFDATSDGTESETENGLTTITELPQRSVGETIGSFRIEQSLGSGAFADVFLAYDKAHDRPIAIKAMKKFTDENGKPEPRSIQTFVEETQILSKLSHVAVAQVYDLAFDEEGFPYVVLEYVKGDSLQFLLREEIVDLPSAIKLLAETADALSEIHQQDVFHRDLKPANIIVGLDGQPRIVDFGLAVGEALQQGRKGEVVGSLSYMSPEQVRGQTHRLDGRTDIWSLGVILYELLTERLPFRGGTRQLLTDEILHRDPRPPRQINPNVTIALESICLDALHKDSTKRTATAHDFAAALRDELGDFADRMADVSSQRSGTAKGRAELRLATQARFWNEKPESQRLPTLAQYANILIRTDSMTRTVAESRMMNASFWYFAKRILTALTALLLVSICIWMFLNSNKIALINRNVELHQIITEIGDSETSRERILLCEKIEDRQTAWSEMNTRLSVALNSGDVARAENYLMAALDKAALGSGFQQAPDSLRLQFQETLQREIQKYELPLIKDLVEKKFGMVHASCAFVPAVDASTFEQIHSKLLQAEYSLVDIDFTEDEKTLAAVWHKHATDSPYQGTLALNEINRIKKALPTEEFDIQDILSPDFFNGRSGLEGLSDFDIRFVDMPSKVPTRKERFARELELTDKYRGPKNGNYYFMKARANYYLENYQDCAADLKMIAQLQPEMLNERYVIDIAAQLYARLSNAEKAVQLLKQDEVGFGNDSTGKLLRSKVNFLLGIDYDVDEAVESFKRPYSRARLLSFLAENSQGKPRIAKAYVDRAIEQLNSISQKPDLYFAMGAYWPDLDYVRSNVDDIRSVFPLKKILVSSGTFNGNTGTTARITGGSQPFTNSMTSHLIRAQVPAGSRFNIQKIRIAKDQSGRVRVSSLWDKDTSQPDIVRPEILAVAMAGKIKLAQLTGNSISNDDLRILKSSFDPTLRTDLIFALARLNPDIVSGLADVAEGIKDPSILQAVLNVLALSDQQVLMSHEHLILKMLNQIEKGNSDPGVDASIALLRKKLGQAVQVVGSENLQNPNQNWYINSVGQTMVRASKNDTHEKYDFWIARTEVTVSRYQQVMHGAQSDLDAPERKASFFHAAEFCNRLSQLAGIPEDQWCYSPNAQGNYSAGMSVKPGYQELTGYRLPTREEWEASYKYGKTTTWEHGNNKNNCLLFENIADTNGIQPVGLRLPTTLGLFDMGGNVAEWLTPENKLRIDDETPLQLGGGYYRLGPKSSNRVVLESRPRSNSFKNATGLRVLRKLDIE